MSESERPGPPFPDWPAEWAADPVRHDRDAAALVARAVAAAPALTDSQRQQVSDLMPPAEHEPAAEDAEFAGEPGYREEWRP